MQYTGGATVGAFLGLPPLEAELAALAPEEIDRSTPSVYLRLDGIPGDATATGHESEIRCLSCRWGIDGGEVRGGRQKIRKPHRGHVTVLKAIDKATPVLYETAASDEQIRSGRATLLRTTSDGRTEPYCVLELHDITVAALETGQHGKENFERCSLTPGADGEKFEVKSVGK